uniref:Uncharacterized protein n=1 Tax=Glossina austeni TaxID=7395 RepID=A0A1A9UR40_GLOAU
MNTTKKNLHLSLDASDDGRNDDLVDLWHPYWRREQPYDTNRWEHGRDSSHAGDDGDDDEDDDEFLVRALVTVVVLKVVVKGPLLLPPLPLDEAPICTLCKLEVPGSDLIERGDDLFKFPLADDKPSFVNRAEGGVCAPPVTILEDEESSPSLS